eukprot:contig_25527_g6296
MKAQGEPDRGNIARALYSVKRESTIPLIYFTKKKPSLKVFNEKENYCQSRSPRTTMIHTTRVPLWYQSTRASTTRSRRRPCVLAARLKGVGLFNRRAAA